MIYPVMVRFEDSPGTIREQTRLLNLDTTQVKRGFEFPYNGKVYVITGHDQDPGPWVAKEVRYAGSSDLQP